MGVLSREFLLSLARCPRARARATARPRAIRGSGCAWGWWRVCAGSRARAADVRARDARNVARFKEKLVRATLAPPWCRVSIARARDHHQPKKKRVTLRVLVWVRSRESQSKKIVVSLVLVLLSATNVESGSARVGRRATSRARAPLLGEVGGGVWDARVSGSGSKIGALGLFRARVRVRVRARGPKGHE